MGRHYRAAQLITHYPKQWITAKQEQALCLLIRGFTMKETAHEMGTSRVTLSAQLGAARKRTRTRSNIHLASEYLLRVLNGDSLIVRSGDEQGQRQETESKADSGDELKEAVEKTVGCYYGSVGQMVWREGQ